VPSEDLPIGIVTFLFTDIEGHTRILERLGERYRAIKERHDAIVRSGVAAGEGREVSTEGDSFFAVFPTPTGAVRAAATIQRELATTAWPDGAIVRVRIGMHTGEGRLSGDTYLGLDVNRAARIAAAAHGGQVLLSDATRALVGRSLPSGTRLRDLGQHRLKDLAHAERLHQLVLDGMEQDFPSPRTLDARPNNLPAQLTRFIGRHDEVARVRELLTARRLVTLTGPGGTGKTRLGLQVATETLLDHRDGAFFVDLSPLSDPGLVAAEIASALAVRPESGRSEIDTVSEHLRDKELLLVLDNFEQVVNAGPSVVEPLLGAAAGVRVLVTSRVPLHLYGEQEFQVPPLALANPERLPPLETLARVEAVALFVERATSRSPEFRITPANARAVAEITARLDGLPLAIELAASRIRLLSPEELLGRLEQRLPLLTAQERNVPERQRTLRRTIEWSYELLEQAEQRLFWRIAVFSGGADLEAVEAVVNPNAELGLDTLDGLASLVDKNLARRVDAGDGASRFDVLETIREYGLERLAESGEESVIHRRHAERWIEAGERLSATLPAQQAVSTRHLEYDHDNVRTAFKWALQSGEAEGGLRLATALRDFWRLSGHVKEGLRWLSELLDLPGAAARTPLRARALTTAADLSGWTGDAATGLSRAAEAVELYRELDDRRGIPDALEELGAAQLGVGDIAAARVSLEEARQLNIGLGNRQKASETTMALGIVALTEQRLDQARERFEDALATFRDLADPYWIAFAERLLGSVEGLGGNYEAGEDRLRASLSIARQHNLPVIIASGLYSFAYLALARGQYERAVRLMGATEALRELVGEAPQGEVAMMGDVRGLAGAFLDETTAERVYEEGRAMELEEAVQYALQPERA
jgi:predicted ATPase/class 3 adenylate cyclase